MKGTVRTSTLRPPTRARTPIQARTPTPRLMKMSRTTLCCWPRRFARHTQSCRRCSPLNRSAMATGGILRWICSTAWGSGLGCPSSSSAQAMSYTTCYGTCCLLMLLSTSLLRIELGVSRCPTVRLRWLLTTKATLTSSINISRSTANATFGCLETSTTST